MRYLLIMLLLFSTAAFAEGDLQWYTVELIVFEHLNPEALEEEQWPDDPGFPSLENAVELSVSSPLLDEEMARGAMDLAPTPHAFVLLHPDEHTLKPVRRRLARLKQYHPLLHIAWRQPGFSKKESIAVHLRGDTHHTGNSANAVELEAPATEDAFLGPLSNIPPVEGTARLYRARYLHMITDIRYFRPEQGEVSGGVFTAVSTGEEAGLGEDLPEDVQPTLFRLTENRRMRSKELHYLDHPLFGMLIQVTPYELPKIEKPPAVAPEEASPTIAPAEEKPPPSSSPSQETPKPL